MSLISRREQDYLMDWAKTAESRMDKVSDDAQSYFEIRLEESKYMFNYEFDTAAEMDAMIQSVLHHGMDEGVRKACVVAAYKEKSLQKCHAGQDDEKSESVMEIPEFIYNF